MRSRLRFRALPVLLGPGLVLIALLTGQERPPIWTKATADHRWLFPDDHRAHHDYRLEWWYFTGHLQTDSESRPRFAYQFTFYRLGLTPDRPDLESDWAARSLIMGHLAVIDLQSGTRIFSEILYRAVPILGGFGDPGDPLIAWSRAPAGSSGLWKLAHREGAFHIEAVDDNIGLSMRFKAVPLKPLVFQAPEGVSFKDDAPDAASRYYSFSRLATEGALVFDNRRFQVRGTSWMDHEFSSGALGSDQVGWDWLSLQLDDGREAMLFRVRNSSQATDFTAGTLIDERGRVVYVPRRRWDVREEKRWRSPSGRASYPVQWQLSIPEWDLSLRLRADFEDQENRSRLTPGLDYWEGSVSVLDPQGRKVGQGFVEMTGYGNNLRPPI